MILIESWNEISENVLQKSWDLESMPGFESSEIDLEIEKSSDFDWEELNNK